ncbi:MAG: ATP-binding protein [Ginsengibacter sp.]
MKKIHKLSLLLSLLFCSVVVRAQSVDSIQQKVMEKIRGELGKKGLGEGYLDSNFLSDQLKTTFESINKGLQMAKKMGNIKELQGGYLDLTKLDSAQGNYKNAYEHYKLFTIYRDSLAKQEAEKKTLQAKMQFEFDKKQAVAKAEQDKKDAEQKRIKNIQYFTIAGLVVLVLVILLIVFIQWRNNNEKKKANVLLQQQKEKAEETLVELKSTQSQLIYSEKMASLGELTAGIAHEIQNPLNFVNNFSEVNRELLAEMREEIVKGNYNSVTILAKDVEENEDKINHHGKRADSIVKGMLQHSRAGTGQKEPTDFNALADEYLRLSYHGLRAKDKNFNAEIKTHFDDRIDKINIVPQDIGRVLLNLYNNAFYACAERSRGAVNDALQKKAPGYKPTVTVRTKKLASGVELSVTDNGSGIPQKAVDKIFQPFFTTKPTGQGTGLGLSLSYDIVKAHVGEIKVDTKEGEGSEFIVTLPV